MREGRRGFGQRKPYNNYKRVLTFPNEVSRQGNPPVAQIGKAGKTRAKNRFKRLSIFVSQGKIVFEVVFDLLLPIQDRLHIQRDIQKRTNSDIDFSVFV